jgi:putative aminopeptidase FrvX
MKLDIAHLQKLCSTHSVSGDTLVITRYLQKKLSEMNIESITNGFGVVLFGNLKNPAVLISAHCDEVGFQVVHQNEDGTFMVNKSGHIYPVMLNNSQVYVHAKQGDILGTFYPKKELGDNKPEHFSEIFLSTMDNTKIHIGDFGSYARTFHVNSKTIMGTGLDNKIGVQMILEIIEEKPSLLKHAIFAFVTEEETTYDCIAGIAAQYAPEYALVLDMLPVHQESGKKVENLPVLGKGPGILYSMQNYHLHPALREMIGTLKTSFQKVFLDISFPPEPQIVQKNGTTKGMNIFIPMYGWHNSIYTMKLSDYDQMKTLVYEIISAFGIHT